ncbi:ribosomal large subunit pseudouridine synthase B [Sphingobium sp. SYK-6]|uniref:pseudouridine synthase n=1 Tax=Sphingobium sp. (strain NBRC 103272 / SYK-6) TaxID=627192 RepID=UPI000227743E|nr:ribosomal large subunit pseudouridine synthase B [Sphingobium sp. SYK-6]
MANATGPRGPRRPPRNGATGPAGGRRRPSADGPDARKPARSDKPRSDARSGARPPAGPDTRSPAGKADARPATGKPGQRPATRKPGARPATDKPAFSSSRPARPPRGAARPAGKPGARKPRDGAPEGDRAETRAGDHKADHKGDRIAKLLARAGIASRRDIERMIGEGRIALDGAVLTTPATILTSLRGVTVDGNPVQEPTPARLFLFHKPTGLLTTAKDPAGRPTIYDRLPKDLPRVMPVGRLDLNTEGLLLLTTDGELKRQLELPATGVERTYRARVFGEVSQAQLEDLIEGVEIEGMRYGRIDANLERRTGRNQWVEMTLTEGKNREVRRVLEHLGLRVSRLIRTRYGPFVLGDSQPGEVVEVRRVDLVKFRKTLD